MPSRKHKQLAVDGEGDSRKKRSRVIDSEDTSIAGDDDDDNDDDRTDTNDAEDNDGLVRKLPQSPLFAMPQTTSESDTEREAGIIEEVRVINFMSHSKLNFKYVALY